MKGVKWTVVPGDVPPSHIEVVSPTTQRLAVPVPGRGYAQAADPHGTLCDRRMGPCGSADENCFTCSQPLKLCAGHLGYITLALPVVPKHFWPYVKRALNAICHTCKLLQCPCPPKTRSVVNDRHTGGIAFTVASAASAQDRLLSIGDAYTLLKAVQPPAWRAHGFHTPPSDCVMFYLPVLPTSARPYAQLPEGWKPDPLTLAYAKIIQQNRVLAERLADQANTLNQSSYVRETHTRTALLSLRSAIQVVFTGSETYPKTAGIFDRLSGKEGRMRQHLMGGRVDQSGRGVIAPDPNLRLDEVGLPHAMARILTVPEIATPFNIKHLAEVAKAVTRPSTGEHLSFTQGVTPRLDVQLGDTVTRPLQDGDIVLFNRQPSLHRASIMAHSVRLLPHSTIRMNPSAAKPYNADFDGDEMNIHVPQSVAAQTEARMLMGVANNIISAQNSSPLMLLTFDSLLGAYQLTSPATFCTREQALQFANAAAPRPNDETRRLVATVPGGWHKDRLCTGTPLWQTTSEEPPRAIPPPTVFLSRAYSRNGKPRELWTGASLVSLILPPRLNVNWPEGTSGDRIVVRSGELLLGRLNKSGVTALVQSIVHACSPDAAAQWLTRAQPFVNQWLMTQGVSVSLSDVMIASKEKRAALQHRIQQGCRDLADRPPTGSPAMQEQLMAVHLDKLRNEAGVEALGGIPRDGNAFSDMVASGSKGSDVNITQIAAALGQQTFSGSRIPLLVHGGRCLPHFERGSTDPHARGFVSRSFSQGISATEFFCHAIGGRQGVVDTVIKTAQSGYSARRLMKSLEGIVVAHDGTVRINGHGIVQFIYGEDGARCEAYRPVPNATSPPSSIAAENEVLEFCRTILGPKPVLENGCCPVGFQLVEDNVLRLSEALDLGDVAETNEVFAATQAFAVASPVVMALVAVRYSSPNVVQRLKWSLQTLCAVLDGIKQAFDRAQIDAGESVGSIAAQSISEVITQMTLNTFHTAGLANSITQGLPRLTEVLSAAHEKTPLLTVVCTRAVLRRWVQGVTLGALCATHIMVESSLQKPMWESIYECLFPRAATTATAAYPYRLVVALDVERLWDLELAMHDLAQLIVHAFPMTKCAYVTHSDEVIVEDEGVRYIHAPTMHVYLAEASPDAMRKHIAALDALCVSGLRACKYEVLEGDGGDTAAAHTVLCHSQSKTNPIAESWGVPADVGIDHTQTTSSDMYTVLHTLGIEAACATAQRELHKVIKGCAPVNIKHLQLLVDMMGFHGTMLGMTRDGLASRHTSTFGRASYENVQKVVVSGALKHLSDLTSDISFSIGTGVRIAAGTGLGVSLLVDDDAVLDADNVLWDAAPKDEPKVEPKDAAPAARTRWGPIPVAAEEPAPRSRWGPIPSTIEEAVAKVDFDAPYLPPPEDDELAPPDNEYEPMYVPASPSPPPDDTEYDPARAYAAPRASKAPRTAEYDPLAEWWGEQR